MYTDQVHTARVESAFHYLMSMLFVLTAHHCVLFIFVIGQGFSCHERCQHHLSLACCLFSFFIFTAPDEDRNLLKLSLYVPRKFVSVAQRCIATEYSSKYGVESVKHDDEQENAKEALVCT